MAPEPTTRIDMTVLHTVSGRTHSARVLLNQGPQKTIRVELDDNRSLEATSLVDFEDALAQLRTELEAGDLLLLCNRYRVDAFVSSLSRQMTDGLGCYLVQHLRPVSPEQMVDALAPAPVEMVTTRAANEAFIDEWIDEFRREYGPGG